MSLREALERIAAVGCYRSLEAEGCLYPGSTLSFDAKYGADRMCTPCFARKALADEPRCECPWPCAYCEGAEGSSG